MDQIICKIIEAARSNGVTQEELARASHMPASSLSRLKKGRGNPTLKTLNELAERAGVVIAVVERSKNVDRYRIPSDSRSFREKHRSLVWSNPDASDSVYIRKALLSGKFTILMDAFSEFGMERLELEWRALLEENDPSYQGAIKRTSELLGEMRHGYDQACAQHESRLGNTAE